MRSGLTLNSEEITEKADFSKVRVPHKYGYKSAKWAISVTFTEEKELDYREKRGYSDTAGSWTEDRYS